MEHVVFYPAADGSPVYTRLPSLEDAAGFVEHMRNTRDLTDFSVHALTPVPVSFRAYYHVESPEVPDLDVDASVWLDRPVDQAVDQPEWTAPAVEEAPPFAEAPPIAQGLAFAETPVPLASVPLVDSSFLHHEVESPVAYPTLAEVPAEADAFGLSVVPEPVAVEDDDRSAEWVAEATVRELPVLQARLVEVPVVAAPAADTTGAETVHGDPAEIDELSPADVRMDQLSEPLAMAIAPMVSQTFEPTPFATAPPVMPQVTEALTRTASEPASAEAGAGAGAESATDADATTDAVAGAVPTPSGRRSMGFFAR